MQDNFKELMKLIQENPELRVVPMVEYEVCGGDECAWWEGKFGTAKIDEVFSKDEYIYIKSKDQAKLIEEAIEDDFIGLENDVSTADAEDYAEKKVDAYDWEKVILVHINTP